MRNLLIILFFLGTCGFTMSQNQSVTNIGQANDPEIGIVEHLDQILPEGIMVTGITGEKSDLKSLINKPTILNLVYFRCPGICSPIMNSIQEIIPKMGLKLGRDYQVVTISFDSREGYELAASKHHNYMKRFTTQIDTNGWEFFACDSASIVKLTNAVGFKFKRAGNDYIHAGVLIILSPEAKITRYHNGIYFLPFDIKLSLVEAAQGKATPTIGRVLSFCYAYDPEGQHYVLQITKLAGIVIIFFGIITLLVLIFKPKHKTETSTKSE